MPGHCARAAISLHPGPVETADGSTRRCGTRLASQPGYPVGCPAIRAPNWVTQILGATLAQLVEHVTENHGVPSSILGGRTISSAGVHRVEGLAAIPGAGVAQLVEHFTRNEGVSGSIPLTSSM